MTSIERTAYPAVHEADLRPARVLHVFFAPTAEEIGWAQERTAGQESLFALVLALKMLSEDGPVLPAGGDPGGRDRTRAALPGAGIRRRCLIMVLRGRPSGIGGQVRVRQGVTYDRRGGPGAGGPGKQSGPRRW